MRPSFRATIVADITAKINSGEWPPDHRLPSQRELAKAYRCSVQPVIAALDELETRGLIESKQGVGWFVAHHSVL
jgi:GntR family histidine utilization transcriptional repressor